MAKRGLAKNDPAQAIHARRLIAARISRYLAEEQPQGEEQHDEDQMLWVCSEKNDEELYSLLGNVS